MSMAQYEAENLGENVIIERNEDKRHFENRFALRKIALTLLPLYNRCLVSRSQERIIWLMSAAGW